MWLFKQNILLSRIIEEVITYFSVMFSQQSHVDACSSYSELTYCSAFVSSVNLLVTDNVTKVVLGCVHSD
jgi:hypothetical protein